ncbi:MAG: hypothetical protein E7208_05920 [Clostridium butyricum]|nr:hypothetical protein [Clostridium butyricum]
MENIKFEKNKYEFTSVSPIMLMNSSDSENKSEQISLFIEDLNIYSVFLKDLVNFPLKDRERNVALNLAYYIIENEQLKDNLILNRALNISKLSRATKIRSDYIKKWKDYIIAYCIILNSPEYKFIQDYLKIKLKEKNRGKNNNNKQKTYRGIVIKILSRNSAYILTSMGEFKRVKLSSALIVGSIAEGKKKMGPAVYKIPVSIMLLFLIIFGVNIYLKYTTVSTIVVVQTTSNIKLHTNIYNRVIYSYSPTERGKQLVSNINAQNKKLDEAIAEVLKYGVKNEMVTQENAVYITVTGEPLKYGELKETNKFIIENKIKAIINNCGVQQKLLKEINEE